MKSVEFLGDSLDEIRRFPMDVRQDTGFQLDKVQRGDDPDDWKPLKTVGKGVREIRIKDSSGIFRVLYVAHIKQVIYVLHAFKKKTQKTRNSDIELARKRLREIGD